MTDSRVEAVARALDPEPWHEADMQGDVRHWPESLQIAIHRSNRDARRAIEASDAWLVEQVAAEADKQIADRHEPEDTDR